MASEQLSDGQDLQALQQQAVMESFVEQDMERWGLSGEVPPEAISRIASILLNRARPSPHNYHAGGRGQSRPDYSRGDEDE